ncbi:MULTISPECIES: hypothetical protein [unclassified Meiothermus]|uniref:hypothetical protein n=1 Tax=unclassified Meiothermus TaxID=370471 RepID=UPI000D7BCE9F|nr:MULTISPECIES: hypothetical protein [unclassified Meiothermus]PZA06962.1 hypothetical protein DNA98_09825 [Meiothermus sp. Pnk-1]RYM38351.1 hypothetical protein EWH23_04910 [Meiothermus sp. PNK-Is4]
MRACAYWTSLLLIGGAPVQAWQAYQSPGFIVQIASPADARYLPRLFQSLERARRELRGWGLRPPDRVRVVVHPTLGSYRKATAQPWFVLAQADRAQGRIDLQRLSVVVERGGLEAVLRHEYFHLAQPEGWARWLAEGSAMIFAAQRPSAKALEGVSTARLEEILAAPPQPQLLARAMATAYARAQAYWKKRRPAP